MPIRSAVPTSAPRLRRPAVIALAALLTLAAGACSDKSAPKTTAPPGYTVVSSGRDGFAIAFPGDWVQIPLTNDIDKFDTKARELQTQNASLGPAIIVARQLAQSRGKMFAVSPDGKAILNITSDKTKEKSLKEIGDATSKTLQETGGTNLAQEQTTTGAGKALKLTFKYPIVGRSDSTVIADETQFYVLRSGRSWVITVINGSAEVASAIAQSFKLR